MISYELTCGLGFSRSPLGLTTEEHLQSFSIVHNLELQLFAILAEGCPKTNEASNKTASDFIFNAIACNLSKCNKKKLYI